MTMENRPEYFNQLFNCYENVPSLHCGDCWGECCVSPTMTAGEFVYMMNHGLDLMGTPKLLEFIQAGVREHRFYEGNQHCRFQDYENGRCQIYPGRALACRLHGHDALKNYQVDNMEFCAKKPDHDQNLKQNMLEEMFQTIRNINDSIALPYEEPYYMLSMNLDCWLDFFFHADHYQNRPQLQKLANMLHQSIELDPQIKAPRHTTLAGKLSYIDKLYTYIEDGNGPAIADTLNSLIFDFPSTGSYFLEEAKEMLKMVQDAMGTAVSNES